jgi:hypothetical protein
MTITQITLALLPIYIFLAVVIVIGLIIANIITRSEKHAKIKKIY